MKTSLAIVPIVCAFVAGMQVTAQTINWGSPMFSDLVDSNGVPLDETFAFELGAFVPNFTPDETNVEQWAANWRPFDSAAFNGFEIPDDGIYGYFTSTVQMSEGGHSSNPAYANLGLDFQDLDAYLWIHNSTTPQEGTEWLLVRAESWVFPLYQGCCANDPPLEWSVSELTSNHVPVFGRQGDTQGAGAYTNDSTHTLQTYTFVPEPSAALMLTLAGTMLAFRRRRNL